VDPLVKISALNRGGGRLSARGLGEEAVKCFTKALDLLNENGLKDNIIRATLENNLGHLKVLLGKQDDALICFVRAEGAYQKAGDLINAARQVANQGSVFRDSGRLSESLACYRKALSGFLGVGCETGAADQYGNIAYILALSGDSEGAGDQYKNALFLYRKTGQHERAGLVEKNLAALGMIP